jgi:hypothetical protein
MDEHTKKYQALAEQLREQDKEYILKSVLNHIEGGKYGNIKGEHPAQKLESLIRLDKHLNNIPLRFWDNLAGFTQKMGQIIPIGTVIKFPGGLSWAERVCLIKYIVKR